MNMSRTEVTTTPRKAWTDQDGQFHIEDEDGGAMCDRTVLAAQRAFETLGDAITERMREEGIDPAEGMTEQVAGRASDLLRLLCTLHQLLWHLDPMKYPEPTYDEWELAYEEADWRALGLRLKENLRKEVAQIESERPRRRAVATPGAQQDV